jgi:hypothetical protein
MTANDCDALPVFLQHKLCLHGDGSDYGDGALVLQLAGSLAKGSQSRSTEQNTCVAIVHFTFEFWHLQSVNPVVSRLMTFRVLGWLL